MDWNTEITDFEGRTVFAEDNVALTLGRAAVVALTIQSPEDQNSTGEDRFKLGRLASKIIDKENLSIEDLAIVKTRIGKFFNPTVVYKAWLILDPTNGK